MGLSAFSLILMPDGSERRVEDLEPGDTIWEAIAGAPVAVAASHGTPGVGMYTVTVDNGMSIVLTGDHRVLTVAGWQEAAALSVNTSLQTRTGPAVCVAVEALPGDYKVYDPVVISSAGDVGGFADGIVVGFDSVKQ